MFTYHIKTRISRSSMVLVHTVMDVSASIGFGL